MEMLREFVESLETETGRREFGALVGVTAGAFALIWLVAALV